MYYALTNIMAATNTSAPPNECRGRKRKSAQMTVTPDASFGP